MSNATKPFAIESQTYDAGKSLFAYLAMGSDPPSATDCVIVLGSKYLNVASYAGELCARYAYPAVVFSGNRGRHTGSFNDTEAEVFERIARPRLPPTMRVYLEKNATNTGENLRFSLQILADNGIACRDVVLVQNATMTRRALATSLKLFPALRVTCLRPTDSYDAYLASPAEAETFIDDMVGNLQRILLYPQLGHQIQQMVPADVLDAYHFLLERGYDRQLVARAHGYQSGA